MRPDSTADRICSDSPAATDPSEVTYWEVTTEPRTATPRAPPSSRVVSFMAEPTPALPSGTDTMMRVVSGVIVSAMPAASGSTEM